MQVEVRGQLAGAQSSFWAASSAFYPCHQTLRRFSLFSFIYFSLMCCYRKVRIRVNKKQKIIVPYFAILGDYNC